MIVLFPSVLFSQENLIRNPGFELYDNCPTAPSNFEGYVEDWRSFHYQPSYNHECDYSEPWGVLPYQGQGLTSIVLFTNRFNVHWRYLHTQLKRTLKPQVLYYLEFQHHNKKEGYQIKKYQAYFSHQWHTIPYPDDKLYIELNPHFETSQEDWAPFDKWVRRSGCFQVNQAYEYMMFGNFMGAATDTFTNRIDALQAYTQLDNFALFEVEELNHENISLCPSEEYELPYYNLTGMYYLLNGDTLGKNLPLLSPGSYEIEQHLDGCGWFNSFSMIVIECGAECMEIPDDITICAFESLDLNKEYDYQINNELIDSNWNFKPGLYQLEVSNEICGVFSEITLEVLPCTECIEFERLNSIICIGDEIELKSYDKLQDLTICANGEIIGPGLFQRNDAGTYQIVYKSEICDLELIQNIVVEECEACNVYIPNAFTPNGDGLNDFFQVFTACAWLDYHLLIYDRWGSLIFESKDPMRNWDGNYLGEELPQSVFVYLFKGKMRDGISEKVINKTGDVTILK